MLGVDHGRNAHRDDRERNKHDAICAKSLPYRVHAHCPNHMSHVSVPTTAPIEMLTKSWNGRTLSSPEATKTARAAIAPKDSNEGAQHPCWEKCAHEYERRLAMPRTSAKRCCCDKYRRRRATGPRRLPRYERNRIRRGLTIFRSRPITLRRHRNSKASDELRSSSPQRPQRRYRRQRLLNGKALRQDRVKRRANEHCDTTIIANPRSPAHWRG